MKKYQRYRPIKAFIVSGFFLAKIRSISLHWRCKSNICRLFDSASSHAFRFSFLDASSSRCSSACISSASARSFRAACNSVLKMFAHSCRCCASIFKRSISSCIWWLVSRNLRCICEILSYWRRKLFSRSSVSFSVSFKPSICCSSARSRVHENEVDADIQDTDMHDAGVVGETSIAIDGERLERDFERIGSEKAGSFIVDGISSTGMIGLSSTSLDFIEFCNSLSIFGSESWAEALNWPWDSSLAFEWFEFEIEVGGTSVGEASTNFGLVFRHLTGVTAFRTDEFWFFYGNKKKQKKFSEWFDIQNVMPVSLFAQLQFALFIKHDWVAHRTRILFESKKETGLANK